jgi:hypothetical protein
MKKIVLGTVCVVLVTAGLLWSAATTRNETVIWNFVNGIKIAGVSLSQDGLTTLANNSSIDDADGEGIFTLGRTTSGTVTVTAKDDNANAALTVKAGGTGNLVVGGTSSGTLRVNSGTNGTVLLGRSDAGTVTVTAADDDATAALTVLPGGAAALVLGGASTTSVTITADGAQNADLVVPANSIGGGEVSGVRFDLIFCGQADENGTIYLSPAAGINGATIGARPELAGATCDGLDGAVEATQDIVIFPNNAFKVMGMYCMQNGAEVLGAAETMIFTMRSAAADLTPTVTCTISAGETGCASLVGSTTNVAAGATVAMKLVMSSNNTDQDAWCSVSIMLQ